ncbi:PTS sugar transporter subunit IIA [Catenisphaera adipataccumulans]|jgi:PTS system ascorbate-specific IIA component|uniref:Ascorbate-specific PTS system EIIA component n=2 Tax=Catenisphaera adipataccumulans TaxID=700500 RepID=A0A7W8CWZ5_9FIRM|nr:PTS sugar transporter subunit IIA [Catenisphaera adipataccumulans]MBB5183118.1 PTS system ascorbate-specific IIA component [Catenisphaera adipataccumulans]
MIDTILKEKHCVIKDSVRDWKEAIHVALEPLIQDGCCTEEYEKAVFKNTEEYGAYYVLTDDMALIHASNEAGVNDTQLAVTVLKKPVHFTEDGPDVRILIALCAKDSTSHMEGMMAIANIFGDDGNVQPILDAKSGKEIYDVFLNASES